MNNNKSFFALLATLVLLLLATGCVSVDYVGRKFPATDHVEVYTERQKMPQDKYTIIGRFTVTSRYKVSYYEAEDAVFRRAADYGGDAICLVSNNVEKQGVYNTPEQEFGSFDTAKRVIPENEKQFGKVQTLTDRNVIAKRRVVKFLLLRENKKFNPAR